MERLVFPGNKFSYNMESVPNGVISIVIRLGGKWLKYFALNLVELYQTERTSFNHIIARHHLQIIGTIPN